MAATQGHFGEDYVERYERKSRLLKRPNGERIAAYTFWSKYIARHISPGTDVLEVGCGCGFFLQRLNEKYNATGLEISLPFILKARQRCHEAHFVRADAQALPFRDQGYGCVIAFDVVEHILDPAAFLSESFRVLKPNGLLVFTTPNLKSLGAILKGRRPEFRGKPYDERHAESYIWRDETHINLKRPDDWLQLCRKSGFCIIDQGTDTIWDLPYTNRVPLLLQELFLVPFNLIFQSVVGFCAWTWGEVLVIIARKYSDDDISNIAYISP